MVAVVAVAFGFFVADFFVADFFLLLVALFVVFFGVAAFFFDTRDPINVTRRAKRPML